MVSYIDLMNRFWKLDEECSFSGNETRLYFYLLSQANKRGWPDEFEHGDKKTEANAGYSPVTLRKCRERLVQVGLIDFVEGGKGQGSQVKYLVRYQNLTPNPSFRYQDRCQKVTPNEGDRCEKITPTLTPNSALVIGKMLKTNTYSIYKRNKTFYSLSLKGVREKVISFLGVKKQHLKSNQKLRADQSKARPKRTDPFTIKSDSEKLNVPYSTWKNLYHIDGSDVLCRRLWIDLTDEERLKALAHTPKYMQSAAERWLKQPENYLETKLFNNRIIDRNDKSAQNTVAGPTQFGAGAQLGTAYRRQTIGRGHSARNGSTD